MNHTKKIFYRPHIIFQFVTESRLCIQVKFFEISLAVHFRWRQLSFGLRFWSVLFRWRLLSIWWSNFLSVHFWTVVDCSILNYQLLERLLRNRSLSRPSTFGRSLSGRQNLIDRTWLLNKQCRCLFRIIRNRDYLSERVRSD